MAGPAASPATSSEPGFPRLSSELRADSLELAVSKALSS